MNLPNAVPWYDADNTPVGRIRDEIVRNALLWVPILEEPQGSNRGPEIDQFMDAVGSPRGLSWCAALVAAVYAKSGAKIPPVASGACETWRHWAGANYHGVGIGFQGIVDATLGSYSPQPGDMVLYDFHGVGVAHHCGILVREGWVVEGNTSPKANDPEGYCSLVKPISSHVLGYVSPESA